ncbi:DMT family transporter [Gaoshiqia sediminis]|uniref:DMT family transporter n=1 Tax=Gaoshiqia sediminis TaxID=2986998 RepID=A0AA41YDI9_9BACT|nr:DMT family transporter [Gaoshiqia sediminis]MCW0483417.1 DMT family transporter [Gaoshiqia sediminis]
MKNKTTQYYGAALLAMFFWSFSFVWFKVAYKAYDPMTVVLFRLSLSTAIMFVFAKLIGKLQPLKKSDFGLMVLLSFFEPFLYFMGESYGLKYVSPTVASVIVATIPLFTPMAAWYFHKEKISWANFAGLTISFLGVSLVVFDRTLGFTASPLGVSLEFVAVLSTIGYAILLKRLTNHYNGYTIISYQNLFGSFMFLPFWSVFEAEKTFQTPFHPEAFGAIVKLAIFASILGFIFFTYSIRHLGINKSNMFINVMPVFVVIFSYFILGDEINAQKIIGVTVVIAGLFLAQLKRRKRKNGDYPVFQT